MENLQAIYIDASEMQRLYSIGRANNMRVLSKLEVSKRTGLSYSTTLRLCREQVIKTTIDGRVTEQALQDYLNINSNSQSHEKS